MSSRAVGVIAEDATDCETIRVFLRRLSSQQVKVQTRHAGGCGNIFRKSAPWASDLIASGCTSLIIIKDLDRSPTGQLNSLSDLLDRMQSLQLPGSIPAHYCIPVEEIEAWFWADQNTLNKVARSGRVQAQAKPENMVKPKEALMRISRDSKRRAHYSTLKNPDLAETLDLGVCADRCPSFSGLCTFIKSL